MNRYKFTYRKVGSWFWKTKIVISHIKEQAVNDIVDPKTKITLQRNFTYIDAMLLEFEDGTIQRIPQWSKYEMKLGLDWKESKRKDVKDESGTDPQTI